MKLVTIRTAPATAAVGIVGAHAVELGPPDLSELLIQR